VGDDLNLPPETSNSPRAIVYFCNKGKSSATVFLCGGTRFALDQSLEASEIVYGLLSLCYVFDLKYPAAYGILAVIDKIVLHHKLPVDESVAFPPARRRRAARGNAVPRVAPTTKVDKFIDDFVIFRASLN